MRIYACEGTWATEPWGFLGEIVSRLNSPVVRVSYPEQYGDAFSYNESVYIGKRALKKLILQTYESYIIIGYSQGAHIAGDVALEFKDDDNFKGVFLIADPKRSIWDKVIGPDPGGKGVFGSRPVGPKAYHFAAIGDIITANKNPFISNVARYTLDKKRKGAKAWFKTFQSARQHRIHGGKLIEALKEVKDYLSTKVHTNYSNYIVENGLTVPEWIAVEINKLLEKDSFQKPKYSI